MPVEPIHPYDATVPDPADDIVLHTGLRLDMAWAISLIDNPGSDRRAECLSDLARVLLAEVIAADRHITALEAEGK